MAADSNVKVLGTWHSPFVMSVRIALHLKSVGYEYVEEDLLEFKSELLLKSNPVHKKVPVLIHGDKPLCESLIIVQYINEVWTSAPSILPSDPYDRAQARFWAAYVNDKFFPAMRKLLVTSSTEEAKKANTSAILEGVVLLEEAFKNLSKGKVFFGGNNLGYVDLAMGTLLVLIKVMEKSTETEVLSKAKTPSLAAWADCFSSHAAVKDIFPDVDELDGIVMKLRAKSSKAAAATTTN
ncbi:hypothetical protein V6N13_149262 [Hibiscus sabdariffa]|uniref:glutathione transferase n=1 Tax=Hibiscus sabdariffa TaxID=183260 RepID=A0ABR2EHV9_9ROSI